MKRRKFIKQFCSASVACSMPIAITTLQSCSDLSSENDSKDNSSKPGDVNSIQFDLNDQQLSPLKTVGGSIVTMSSDFDRAGLVMYRESLDDLLVFSRSCSHAGTSINAFSNGVATCPNHGAKFNIDGSAISGPTNAPLLQYSSRIDGSIVTITK